jgi:hypothetical protein
MASPVSGIVGHIAAASTVLSGLAAVDEAAYQTIASAQRQRVEQALRLPRSCSLEEMAAVTEAITKSSFPPEHKNALMLAVASSSALSPASAAGSKFQNFEALVHYLPTSVVDRVGTNDFTTALLQFALRLGLRKPSEGSLKELSLVALVGSEGMQQALVYSPETRIAMLESTKDAWLLRFLGCLRCPRPPVSFRRCTQICFSACTTRIP